MQAPGIVDQHVQVAEHVEGAFRAILARVQVGDIRRHHQRVPLAGDLLDLVGDLVQRLFGGRSHGDARAALRQPQRHRVAQPPVRARDDDAAPGQVDIGQGNRCHVLFSRVPDAFVRELCLPRHYTVRLSPAEEPRYLGVMAFPAARSPSPCSPPLLCSRRARPAQRQNQRPAPRCGWKLLDRRRKRHLHRNRPPLHQRPRTRAGCRPRTTSPATATGSPETCRSSRVKAASASATASARPCTRRATRP